MQVSNSKKDGGIITTPKDLDECRIPIIGESSPLRSKKPGPITRVSCFCFLLLHRGTGRDGIFATTGQPAKRTPLGYTNPHICLFAPPSTPTTFHKQNRTPTSQIPSISRISSHPPSSKREDSPLLGFAVFQLFSTRHTAPNYPIARDGTTPRIITASAPLTSQSLPT
ncbi:hypothetical protein DL95DRAFT_178233 [Leptodontidium sp. 2 PMI_412]|nr:hypothetical protein DL95DRAFT_178233 [Leptodontidium sp. 2 PMI_412]